MTTMKVRTCPNCGANVNGIVCAYCGTVDSTTFNAAIGKTLMMSVELGNGEIATFGFVLEELSFDASIDNTCLYADNGSRVFMETIPNYKVNMTGSVVPVQHEAIPEKDIYFMRERK